MNLQQLLHIFYNLLSEIAKYFTSGVQQLPPRETSLSQVLETENVNELSTMELVVAMLKIGADVNEKDVDGRTPLMVAASRGDCEALLQILLDYGANLSDQDVNGRTALMYAIKNERNALFLLKFTQNCDFLNMCNRNRNTALSNAAHMGKAKIVKEMLDRGAHVNVTSHYEWNTPLFTALVYSSDPDEQVLEMLLKAGSDVNYQATYGRFSPLMSAACRYTTRSISGFLTTGHHVIIKYMWCFESDTLSASGCFSGRPKVEELFTILESGRNEYKNSYDVYKTLLTAMPSYERVLRIILEAGADVNAVWKRNSTKTALSFLPSVSYRGEVTIFCMDAFLERFAMSPTVNPVVLQEVILHGAIDVIPKLIQCGLLPAEIEANKSELRLFGPNDPTLVSPLCLALLTGNVSLAHYFMDNLFLTSSDVSKLASNKTIRKILERKHQYDCLSFFDEMATQPMSLFRQAFVAVSSVVGTSPGRASRVQQLHIPMLLKNYLLFNPEQVKLCVPARI